jgi:hypothetical protein
MVIGAPRIGNDVLASDDASASQYTSGHLPSWLTAKAAIACFVGEPAPHRALTGDAATLRRIADFFSDSRPTVGGAVFEIFCIPRHWAPQVLRLRFGMCVTALRHSCTTWRACGREGCSSICAGNPSAHFVDAPSSNQRGGAGHRAPYAFSTTCRPHRCARVLERRPVEKRPGCSRFSGRQALATAADHRVRTSSRMSPTRWP